MKATLKKYETVFRSELLKELPLKRPVDRNIETEARAKPPQRPLFQLSLAESVDYKQSFQHLLKNGKVRLRKSPFGAPLFFVRDKKYKPLRGLIDY